MYNMSRVNHNGYFDAMSEDDLYDNLNMIPFDKIEGFYKKYLK